jgi:hypothetical protein
VTTARAGLMRVVDDSLRELLGRGSDGSVDLDEMPVRGWYVTKPTPAAQCGPVHKE